MHLGNWPISKSTSEAEAVILDLIRENEQLIEKVRNKNAKSAGLAMELVESLKDILWELIFNYHYATDAVRTEVEKEAAQRLEAQP